MSVSANSRVLTFLIADVRGYTSFTQRHGDEAAARLAAGFAEIAREGVEAHGGEVIELRGDEALAVFGSAADALRAAVDLQLVFADEIELHPALPLRVGIGLDSGAAVPVEGGYRGAALNLAARLCSKAGAGEVFASQSVLELAPSVAGLAIHDNGEFEMKGLAEPVRVARVSRADLHPDVLVARFESDGWSEASATEVPPSLDTTTPIVGREREVHQLRWAWRRARRDEGRTLFVLGPPGIGKTRLMAELAASAAHDGASVSYISCREPVDRGLLDRPLLATPSLLVLDDAEIGSDAPELVTSLGRQVAGRGGLLVVAADDSALSPELRSVVPASDDVIRPATLSLDDVRQIAGLYLGAGAEALPASLLESTGGVPRRIHKQVSEWAYAEAGRRLGAAASRAAAGRSDLRSVESELAGNVVDLQQIRERARSYETGGARTVEPAGSPFKGLAAFEVADADLFFGRERSVAELIARLAGASLLGVVGPSGSGKSSAVRAGLIPAIRGGVFPGSDGWIVALMRPGEHPVRELRDALAAAVPAPLREQLGDADVRLRDLRDVLAPDGHALIVVDQFEEVFTACSDETERADFLAALTDAVGRRGGRVTAVLAVRADFYGRCAADPALAELLAANHVLIGPMSGDELRRAIEQPAFRMGVHVEPALTESLVAEVVDEPGGLPLLSTALLELWERREGRVIRLDAYLATDGVRGAVSRLAEEVYSGLTPDQQAVARAVMLRLAGPGEGDAVVRRRVPLAEFDAERNEDIARVVTVLTDRRLLTVSDGIVEVAHEALLREWPRLAGWLEEDRAGRVLHGHLIDSARGWAHAERDPGELYRGARLASALDWTTDHTLELNELERDFLSASREATERDVARQRRTNRRLRGLLVGVAVFLVVAIIAGGIALVQRGKAEEAATQSTAQRLGAQAVVEDELDLSLLLARQGFELFDSEDTRSTLLASLLKAPGAIRVLPGTGDRVLLIRGSGDGSVFATTDNVGGVAIYDAQAMKLDRIVRFDDQYLFDISPDGATLAGSVFAGGGPQLAMVDTRTGATEEVPLPEGADFAASYIPVAFDPDGSRLVSFECRPCGKGPPVFVERDPRTGAELDVVPAPNIDLDVDRIFFSHDGAHLVLVGSPGQDRMVFLDATTFAISDVIESDGLFTVDVSPDGRTVAVGRQDGTVVLIDVAAGRERELDGRHTASVQGIGFSPDGSTLLSTGDDRDVIVWDVKTRAVREILHGHAGRVFGPAFSGDGSTAFTVGLDSKVIAWDLSGERRIGRALPIGEGHSLDPEFALMGLTTAAPANGEVVATTTAEGNVAGVDPATGHVRWEVDPWSDRRIEELRSGDPGFADTMDGWVTEMAFSPDGTVLAVAGQNPEVVLYDPTVGTELGRWSASRHGWVNGVSFAPDGSLVTASDDGRVVLWDPQSGDTVREYRLFDEPKDGGAWEGAPFRAYVSPDGEQIAIAVANLGAPTDVTVLDADTGERRWTQVSDAFVAVPAWSPDSRVIAVGGWQDGSLTLMDATRHGERLLEPVNASAGFVLTVGFTPDGSTIVTGASDGTVRLWDADTLKQVGANLPEPDNEPAPAMVVEGDQVLSVSGTGELFRWDLDPFRWAEQACTVADRTLTRAEWELFMPDREYAPACRA